jgi:AcrR family transcriptional regulator
VKDARRADRLDSIVKYVPQPRTSRAVPGTNGSDSFLSPAAVRMPVDGLGPRAQRTIARIIAATRDVFLTRGYSGTTVDEIARIANVSRASFYTYFPTKREVLLAVGELAATDSLDAIEGLSELGKTRAGIRLWVADYFALLDIHGSFALAWTQAAHEDREIRRAGMRRHLQICTRFGELLAETAGRTPDQPELLGLVATSLLERSWTYSQLYEGTVDRDQVIAQAARALWSMARPPSPAGAAV